MPFTAVNIKEEIGKRILKGNYDLLLANVNLNNNPNIHLFFRYQIYRNLWN